MRRLVTTIIVSILLLSPLSLMARNDSTRVYQGFSGGMLLHTGYLFGKDGRAPSNAEGVLCSPAGATFGIGGTMRVHLWKLLRVGCEGFVSSMPSSTTDCRDALQRGSYIRSGWGGINMDACWRDLPPVAKTQLWPYIGASLGGGATHSFYLLEGSQYDWAEEQHSVIHKQSFLYVDPYIGFDVCVSRKMHLTFRIDWLLALNTRAQSAAEVLQLPTGPRLYLGFMFCH